MPSEILIIGGGLSGLSTAAGLLSQGFTVTLLEKNRAHKPDNRVTSLNRSSVLFYTAIGVWEAMSAHAQPMHDIRVVDGPDGNPLTFETAARDTLDASTECGAHGAVVHNQKILDALEAAVSNQAGFTRIHGTVKTLNPAQSAERSMTLADGRTLKAPIICAADGVFSPSRTQLGIDCLRRDHNQANITATLTHAGDHEGFGFQRFLSGGPVAFIPMLGSQSSLAWTLPRASANAVMQLGDEAFLSLLSDQVFAQDQSDARGPLTAVGPRSTYPIKAQIAHRFHDERILLIGDSAHAIHPLAGQGFNLSLRDTALAVDLLMDARTFGEDIGGAKLCAAYTRSRRADIWATFLATDSLNRLFSTRSAPFKAARSALIAMGRRQPRLSKLLAAQAQGSLLGLPRLMQAD